MNRTLVLISALGAGLTSVAGLAQTTAPTAPATSAPAAAAPAAPAAPPQAIPAKIALIAFEQAVFATNEGQVAVQNVQKKYEPKKNQIDALAQEVDTLKKQAQGGPTTLSDAERATRLKSIDTKEKQLNREAEDAQNAYQADLQEAYGKVAQKVSVAVKNYVTENGYTILLDVSNQQTNNVMWVNPKENIDITQAVVNAYNASSGVAAPPPAAPSASAPAARPRPATTAPKPAAPKQ
jgi:Skp family chaperone for outer membrane proteins